MGGDGLMDKSRYVQLHRDILHGVTSVHQGFMPELELAGLSAAKGIWAFSDHLDFRGAPGPFPSGASIIRGYGHYHEEYVKHGHAWRISSLRVSRLKQEELVGGVFRSVAYSGDNDGGHALDS